MAARKENASVKDVITVKQIRSGAGRDKGTKATLGSLGLGRIGQVSTLASNPAVLGMIRRVEHLVEIQNS
jgi:large subunit ribosomal protein L30